MPAENNGLIIGLVTSLDDPESLGRVKVQYPTLGQQESDWARLVSLMAGKDRGVFFRPEVGDEVLVGFEKNDPRQPYILGSVWSQKDTPPPDDGKKTENNQRFMKSRSGHQLILDDTSGSEKIEIIDKDKKRKITIDSANDRLQVECSGIKIEFDGASGKLTISATKVEIKADSDMTLSAQGTMTISGAMVKIN